MNKMCSDIRLGEGDQVSDIERLSEGMGGMQEQIYNLRAEVLRDRTLRDGQHMQNTEKIGALKEGVANFRQFQLDMRAFTSKLDTREEERKDETKRHNNKLILVVAVIGAIPAVLEIMHLLHVIN